MKRRIEVTAPGVRVVAVLDTRGEPLQRDEVEALRDQLATRLQEAVADLRYIGTARCNVRVR